MKTISKILSVVLCLTMVLGLFVVGASATGPNPAANEADFNTIVTSNANGNSSYTGPYTTNNGWTVENSAIQCGGTSDVNPQFKVIGPNNTYKAVCLNGKTSAPGKVTSPTLTGGISKLTIVYTKMFTDTKLGAKITITDLTTNAVYTNTLSKEAAGTDKFIEWTFEWTLETPITGDFTIEVLNTSPSKNSGNKDRLTILNLSWDAAGGSVTPPPATEETTPSTEATTPSETPSTEATTPSETPSTGLNVVAAPVAGTAYKFGMVQQNVSATDVYYLKGGMDGFYMATSSNVADAIDVYLEETTGGYYLYTMEGTTKTYINMVVSGTHVNGAYEATASTVYRFDETSKTLIAVVNDSDYWFGTRNDKKYTTVGPCATSYNGFYCQFYAETSSEPGGVTPPPATEETTPSTEATTPSTEATTPSTEATTPATKPSTTLAPVVKPVAGTAYKFALVQANLSKTLYFNGKMDDSGKFFGTTENAAEAVDVYLEAAQGGYYFYFMDGTTKTYLSLEGYLDKNGKQKAAVKLTTEATTVFTYSEDAKTFIHTIGDTSFYMGTYGTYNTMSASSTSYITGEKAGDVGVSQFVSTFYAPAGGSSNTGDASFISVAAAVLVLSVIGGTALIIKKKEN